VSGNFKELTNFKGRFLRHIYDYREENNQNDQIDIQKAIVDANDFGDKQFAKD